MHFRLIIEFVHQVAAVSWRQRIHRAIASTYCLRAISKRISWLQSDLYLAGCRFARSSRLSMDAITEPASEISMVSLLRRTSSSQNHIFFIITHILVTIASARHGFELAVVGGPLLVIGPSSRTDWKIWKFSSRCEPQFLWARFLLNELWFGERLFEGFTYFWYIISLDGL